MRTMALVILAAALLIGCAAMQLPPEAQRIISVDSRAGCQFVKDMYLQTAPDLTPEALHYSLQWHTHKSGGDAYRILSQVRNFEVHSPFARRFSTGGNLMGENALTTHFEILKCKP